MLQQQSNQDKFHGLARDNLARVKMGLICGLPTGKWYDVVFDGVLCFVWHHVGSSVGLWLLSNSPALCFCFCTLSRNITQSASLEQPLVEAGRCCHSWKHKQLGHPKVSMLSDSFPLHKHSLASCLLKAGFFCSLLSYAK